jgi:anti-sigma B factor antagonist
VSCSSFGCRSVGIEIHEKWLDTVALLALQGDLDMLTASRLNDAVADVLAKAPSVLIVDLTAVAFLASAGMGALITAHEEAGSSTRFGVVADGASTSRPIKLIGLDKVLSLYPTLEDALGDGD